MMNEFPPAFKQAWYQMAENGGRSGVVGINGTEYLELLEAAGVKAEDFPTCQAIAQHQIWQRVSPENATPEAVEAGGSQPLSKKIPTSIWKARRGQGSELGERLRQRADPHESTQRPLPPNLRPTRTSSGHGWTCYTHRSLPQKLAL